MDLHFDLHEIIFSRGDVQGAEFEVLLAIMNRCNCGWIHRKCHPYAEGGKGKDVGIAYLIHYEGLSDVIAFCGEIESMLSNPFLGTRQVNRVAEEMMELYGKLRGTLL